MKNNSLKVVIGILLLVSILSCGTKKTEREQAEERARKEANIKEEQIALRIKPIELSSVSVNSNIFRNKDVSVFEVEGIVCVMVYEALQCDFKNYVPIKDR